MTSPTEKASSEADRRKWVRYALLGGAALCALYVATSRSGSQPSDPQGPQQQQDAGTDAAPVPFPPRVSAPAAEAELALVAPLKVGSQLGSYVVTRIDAVQDGALRVASRHADAVIELDIVLASSTSPLPPAKVGNYAIYFPPGAPSSPDGVPLANALARVVSANLSVPAPPGLAPLKWTPQGPVPSTQTMPSPPADTAGAADAGAH